MNFYQNNFLKSINLSALKVLKVMNLVQMMMKYFMTDSHYKSNIQCLQTYIPPMFEHLNIMLVISNN